MVACAPVEIDWDLKSVEEDTDNTTRLKEGTKGKDKEVEEKRMMIRVPADNEERRQGQQTASSRALATSPNDTSPRCHQPIFTILLPNV